MHANHSKWFIPLILLPLLWMEVSQAFSFCFSSGGGSNNRTNYYNNSFPPPALYPGGYPVYPFSPAGYGWNGGPVYGLPFPPADYSRGYAPVKQE
jgi:hypothetical protein